MWNEIEIWRFLGSLASVALSAGIVAFLLGWAAGSGLIGRRG